MLRPSFNSCRRAPRGFDAFTVPFSLRERHGKGEKPSLTLPALIKACSRSERSTDRAGFTLVELLVVITIIAVLMALLVPAVQYAREAGRRTRCGNNLRQVGLALTQYQASRQTFPPGGIEFRVGTNTAARQLAWSALVLPYLEQDALYRGLNLSKAFDAPENAAAAGTVVPVYVCPTSPRGTKLVAGRGPIDYGGIYGERISGPNNPPKGGMVYDLAYRPEHIIDGLSNTLMVGEAANFPDGQWINGRNLFDQAYAINAAPAYENDLRSQHPGGAGGLLADGSFRFLSSSLDTTTLAALCTRAGKEPLSNY